MIDTSQLAEWSRERLADPADDLFFAVLFSAQRRRESVRAVAALYVELEATATGFADMHVARTKLAWWRDELERLSAGQPAHPVTRALAGNLAAGAETALGDLITGMELVLLEGPVNDLATARMRAERSGTRLAALLTALFPGEKATGEPRPELGTGIGLARLLGHAGLDDTVRQEVARTAQALLSGSHADAATAPQPLCVLAALAWRAAAYSGATTRRRPGPGRVYTAWRAARGHLPRKMSKIGA